MLLLIKNDIKNFVSDIKCVDMKFEDLILKAKSLKTFSVFLFPCKETYVYFLSTSPWGEGGQTHWIRERTTPHSLQETSREFLQWRPDGPWHFTWIHLTFLLIIDPVNHWKEGGSGAETDLFSVSPQPIKHRLVKRQRVLADHRQVTDLRCELSLSGVFVKSETPLGCGFSSQFSFLDRNWKFDARAFEKQEKKMRWEEKNQIPRPFGKKKRKEKKTEVYVYKQSWVSVGFSSCLCRWAARKASVEKTHWVGLGLKSLSARDNRRLSHPRPEW